MRRKKHYRQPMLLTKMGKILAISEVNSREVLKQRKYKTIREKNAVSLWDFEDKSLLTKTEKLTD